MFWPFKRKRIFPLGHRLVDIIETEDWQGGLQSSWRWECSCRQIGVVGGMTNKNVFAAYDRHLQHNNELARYK